MNSLLSSHSRLDRGCLSFILLHRGLWYPQLLRLLLLHEIALLLLRRRRLVTWALLLIHSLASMTAFVSRTFSYRLSSFSTCTSAVCAYGNGSMSVLRSSIMCSACFTASSSLMVSFSPPLA